ncbi:flavodoxin domain-containing protein [Puia dinghuensis]|nr:flavodoxin domain-containing protein [Puia dinghuensis]
MNGVLIYKSRYGTTQQYTEWIGKALDLRLHDPDGVSQQELAAYDFLVIGTPVYFDKMLMRDWLYQHKAFLQQKQVFLFVVCLASPYERAKQDQIINNNVPEGLIDPEHIFFLPGKPVIPSIITPCKSDVIQEVNIVTLVITIKKMVAEATEL